MIHVEIQNSIGILRMDHGKVNAIDIEFMQQLARGLDELESSNARAVILTATGTTFSAGVDLFRILKEGAEYATRFLPLMSDGLERLFLFPKPVIAATNGHAIAGGCILHCACDYRLFVNGSARIGVPELLVGVPFPTVPLEIMRFSVPAPYLQQIIYTGHTFSGADILNRGLADELVAPEKLLERANEIASTLGSIPAKSFAIAKQILRKPAMNQARTAANQNAIAESWISPEVHGVIKNYLDRTIGKKDRK